MVLSLQLRLLPTPEQVASLRRTSVAYNAAASFAAKVGFNAGVFGQYGIHRLCYYEIRKLFGLPSQLAIRAIGKAAETFAPDKIGVCPTFKKSGAVAYDDRNLSFKNDSIVSLVTMDGRIRLPFVCGTYQAERLGKLKGQCDLIEVDGQFYLYACIEVTEPVCANVTDFIGVDMGIVNLATDSDGTTYSGSGVERVRRRQARQRQRLSSRGTKGAKKKLKRIAKKESRFKRHQNHCISKQIVTIAKGTARGIGVEDLTHIRSRTTVRRSQRHKHSSWGFRQLRAFLEYKAKLAGVPLIAVDPRNTSRTCHQCGHCEKGNRRSQSDFQCLHCGFSCNADFNAAKNIAFLAQAACKPASELTTSFTQAS